MKLATAVRNAKERGAERKTQSEIKALVGMSQRKKCLFWEILDTRASPLEYSRRENWMIDKNESSSERLSGIEIDRKIPRA